MIIQKITPGYVIQQFDSEKKQFVFQEFIGGDEIDYEDTEGNALNELEVESFGLDKAAPLHFNMVQPPVSCKKCGSLLEHDRCTDENCPFAYKEQES
jgi:hypothetical protein